MKTSISTSAIDFAFRQFDTPAGSLYVVMRHGGKRRFLSRSAALNNLAHYMVSKVFRRAGIPTNEPYEPVFHNGTLAHRVGDHTSDYLYAHQRCVRRLRRILARKREQQRWLSKWESMHNRFVKERDELQANKPF
ncbi:hypothetical protein R4P48_21480 [Atlantibacter subterranea]|uniref:Uncharacterized protein n=1 Tax=Atlantibacter subterraneus TaxID=255519 RepID=A0ABU4E9N0_9ENTR|nr:hypothetical protein [Atlantibacter subterranea]MDV7025232.1 hypothetical protein [Atlantibacter subterranea]MDZ5668370.1 hypothetical protein [Atlantibacter hermannii]